MSGRRIFSGLGRLATVLGAASLLVAAGARPAAAAKPRVLMIVTSHDALGATGNKTGIWLEELTTPYQVFVEAGADVAIASPKGGAIPVDPKSEGAEVDSVRWWKQHGGQAKLGASLKLASVTDKYDAYFVVGGHGAMWDLAGSKPVQQLLGAADKHGHVIAAVCHGPAALLSVVGADGKPLLSGHRVTGFSNDEERAVKLEGVVPFPLETKMKEAGGRYESKPNFQSFVVRDGRIVTGQNPASAAEAARGVLAVLAESHKVASGDR